MQYRETTSFVCSLDLNLDMPSDFDTNNKSLSFVSMNPVERDKGSPIVHSFYGYQHY